jgi:hypothetical protein
MSELTRNAIRAREEAKRPKPKRQRKAVVEPEVPREPEATETPATETVDLG